MCKVLERQRAIVEDRWLQFLPPTQRLVLFATAAVRYRRSAS
jgi:hypothetical protein